MEKTETKLSARMKAMGFTDKGLAADIGMDRSMITKLRLGVVQPSLRTAMKICDKTGLRPEELIVTEAK